MSFFSCSFSVLFYLPSVDFWFPYATFCSPSVHLTTVFLLLYVHKPVLLVHNRKAQNLMLHFPSFYLSISSKFFLLSSILAFYHSNLLLSSHEYLQIFQSILLWKFSILEGYLTASIMISSCFLLSLTLFILHWSILYFNYALHFGTKYYSSKHYSTYSTFFHSLLSGCSFIVCLYSSLVIALHVFLILEYCRVRISFQSCIIKNYMVKIYLFQCCLKDCYDWAWWAEKFVILHIVDC